MNGDVGGGVVCVREGKESTTNEAQGEVMEGSLKTNEC